MKKEIMNYDKTRILYPFGKGFDMKPKEHAKRISSGEYIYRGFKVRLWGYYEPDHHVAWEGIDEDTGEGIARGFSKRQVMREIDYSLDGR